MNYFQRSMREIRTKWRRARAPRAFHKGIAKNGCILIEGRYVFHIETQVVRYDFGKRIAKLCHNKTTELNLKNKYLSPGSLVTQLEEQKSVQSL